MDCTLAQSAHAFSALGNELRLKLFRILLSRAQDGVKAGDLAAELGVSPSNLSFHLSQLERGGLVVSRRKQRNSIYIADLNGLQSLVHFLTEGCCGNNPSLCSELLRPTPSQAVEKVIFFCSGNSARSVMAEVLFNTMAKGKMRAYSAGSHPFGGVHPYTIDILRQHGLAIWGLRSKNWKEFILPEAPKMDCVITTCNSASQDICPYWPGKQPVVHWNIPDPVKVEGDEMVRREAFSKAFSMLKKNIRIFLHEREERLFPSQPSQQDESEKHHSQHIRRA